MAETMHLIPPGNPMGCEKLTIDNTAGGIHLTESVYGNTGGSRATGGKRYADGAIIQVYTNSIKYVLFGAADAAADAVITAAVGDIIILTGKEQLKAWNAVQGTGAAVIRVQYTRSGLR